MATPAPRLVYGTAWKEGETARLVALALGAGFRGIDTANQRRHYHEAGVGEGLAAAREQAGVQRGDLFLQTKFTYVHGQDHRLPYDPAAPPHRQVAQSFASSLEHLGTDHLDAYLLHGPQRGDGLTDVDWQTWRAMEDLQRSGATRLIGVSNVTAGQLRALHAGAAVRPAIVQNRCFTRPHADAEVRAFCAAQGIAYQGFSLLTAIPGVLRHAAVAAVATRHGVTPEQAILAYCLARGMTVLTGTTDPRHMAQDLAVADLRLGAAELAQVDALVGAPAAASAPEA